MDAARCLSLWRRRTHAVSRGRNHRLEVGRGNPVLSEVLSAAVDDKLPMARRFRGFLPVVVDVECGGFNPATDALLEIALCLIDMDEHGNLVRGATHAAHVEPFPGAKIEAASLELTGIKIDHPFRMALTEREA